MQSMLATLDEQISESLSEDVSDTFPDIMAGAAGEFAKVYSSHLEPPAHFFYMSYLACLGNAAAGKLSIKSELRTESRLYLLILGESADDRKSTAISKTVSFFREAIGNFTNNPDGFKVCHGVGSAEGLQKILEEHGNLLLCFDEFRAFTSKCKIESSVLLPCVTTLFESGHYESNTAKKSINIDNASLSMIGASTIDTYEQIFDENFLAIGFPNRIFLCPGKGARKFSIPRKIDATAKEQLKTQLMRVLEHINETSSIDVTDEAFSIYDQWYKNLPQSIHTKRLDSYALRLMPLLAANELKPHIDEDIARKVIRLMDWQYQARCKYDPIDADSTMAKMEERIRRILGDGETDMRTLRRRTHAYRYGLWVFKNAIENLKGADEIATKNNWKTLYLTNAGTTFRTTGMVPKKRV